MNVYTISIIVPVYNASRYLSECIESILTQSFKDFELLLIDDGSEDDSGVICNEYAKKDSKIRVFHQTNSGVSVARNVGLDNSKGKWLLFVDADDYLKPNALNCLASIAYGKDQDLIIGNVIKKGIDDKEIKLRHSLNNKSWHYNYEIAEVAGLWGLLFKSSIIKENKIRFKEGLAYSEDILFKYQYLWFVDKITSISDCVYVYRMNETSAVASGNIIKKAYHQITAIKYIHDLRRQYKNDLFNSTLLKATHRIELMLFRLMSRCKKQNISAILTYYYQVLGDDAQYKIKVLYYILFFMTKDKLKKIIE